MSLELLDNACHMVFLPRVAIEKGLQVDSELVAQEQITLDDFSRIMIEVYGD